MKRISTVGLNLVIVFLGSSYVRSAETKTAPSRSTIPYVATRVDAVRDMLWMANVGEGDVVYDLGSGDGRISIAAVRDFGARRAVGIELDPERIRESRKNAKKAGVADRVEFIQGDLFATDFSEASVVTLFLGHEPNIKLRAKMLSTLKPGTRVVSHQFGMGEWPTDKILIARTVAQGMWSEHDSPYRNNLSVPGYTGNERHFGTSDRFLMWVIPAPLAGVWRGQVETADGPRDLEVILHQRLSTVTGTFRLLGKPERSGVAKVDIWGDHLRMEFRPSSGRFLAFGMRFDGHVGEDTIQGKLSVSVDGQQTEAEWKARREKVDFTGTWQWPSASGMRDVRLRIEQTDGQFTATYLDGDRETPVTDFYDCGSGFYFTVFFGRDKNGGISINKDTGWLVGEATVDRGVLKGKIEFHPFLHRSKPVLQDWASRLIRP
jgi:SAM-dependent methyltransferase